MTTTYTPSGNPVAETRGISSQVRAEFQLVAAALNVKGDITGQTWTGTHTFPATTYGVTAAFGSTGLAYATLDYVNAVATNAALPGQAGKTDYLLASGGSVASWVNTLNASVIKFVDGTDKTKQVQIDASGLTTATTRTLTAPDKSGTIALTSDIAAGITAANGASMALLGQATVSTAVANIDFLSVFSVAYDRYVIKVEGVIPSVADTLCLRFANTGTIDTATKYLIGIGTDNTTLATGNTNIVLTTSTSASTGGVSLNIEVSNANAVSNDKGMTAIGTVSTNTPDRRAVHRAGAYSGGAISGFRLYWSGAHNFTDGAVRVYGIKNS